MEAKDTVMSLEQMKALYTRWENLPARGTPNFIDYSQRHQAELSFKAGQQNSISLEMQGDAYCSGLMQGRKEVVEWVEEQGFYSCLDPCECLTNNKEYQAKLEEWGIKS